MRAVFLEYAWDMNWCDPCAADPLSFEELRNLGVFWASEPTPAATLPGGRDVFVTRMHIRYDAEHFPEDLVLQETGDRTNFQGRYVLRHPWTGKDECPATEEYRRELTQRQEREAQQLADVTGWGIADIRSQMNLRGAVPDGAGSKTWWEKIWNR